MKVTRHGGKRIAKGDRRGLRTVLSEDEVVERLSGDDVYKEGQEIFFWSEEDDMSLMAIVARQGKVLVSLVPTDRDIAPWVHLLTKFRRLGDLALLSQQNVEFSRDSLISVDLVRFERRENKEKSTAAMIGGFFGYHNRSFAPFWNREFHEMLVEHIDRYVQDDEPTKSILNRTFVRFYRREWYFYSPLFVSYELLGREGPNT